MKYTTHTKVVVFSVAVLFFSLFFTAGAVAETAPVLPTLYWGYVTDHGVLKNGLNVEVYTEGNVLAGKDAKATRNDGRGKDGMYALDVLWDDPNTEEKDGVTSGEVLIFKVEGTTVRKMTVGNKGNSYQVDLDSGADSDSLVVENSPESNNAGTSQSLEGTPPESAAAANPDEINPNGESTLKDNEPAGNTATTTVSVGGNPTVNGKPATANNLKTGMFSGATVGVIVGVIILVILVIGGGITALTVIKKNGSKKSNRK